MRNIRNIINHKRNQGTTLIELLLYMVIFTSFLLVLTTVFTQVIDVQLESQGVSNVEEDGKFIMLRLTHDIQTATIISTPANPGDTANSLQMTVNGVSYTYSLSGNNLMLIEGSSTGQINGYSTTITNLTFKRLGNVGGYNTITINYTDTDSNQRSAGPASTNYEFTVAMRE